MSLRTNSSNMGGLPIIKPRLYYFTTSGTPGTVTSMAVAISGTAANLGAVVTFTSTKSHGVQLGQAVTISGATDTYLNGTFNVTSIVDDKNFTYTLNKSQPNASDAGCTLTYPCHFQRAILVADAGNSDTVSFGPNVDADQDTLAKGLSYLLKAPGGAKHDMADWNIKSASASQNLRISIV